MASPPIPSACIVLLSPLNHVLLLHRGSTSPTHPNSHVFPGGNLDSFHDGLLPAVPNELHSDGPCFRLAAARECFEECGVLLARKKKSYPDSTSYDFPVAGDGWWSPGHRPEMLALDAATISDGRRRVKKREVTFGEWVDSVGGVIDTENLIPFTRWITPITSARRFTTQMYLYLLPLPAAPSSAPSYPEELTVSPIAGSQGACGEEATSATFLPASTWLRRAAAGRVALYPPQYYLLHLIARFTCPSRPRSPPTHLPNPTAILSSPTHAPRTPSPLNPAGSSHHPDALITTPLTPDQLASQRTALLTHVHYPTPPPSSPYPAASPLSPANLNPRGTALARIPPGRRIICPRTLFVRSSDGHVVLGLDEPGPELLGTRFPELDEEDGSDGGVGGLERGGDGEHVAIVGFARGGMLARVEIRSREEVLLEERSRAAATSRHNQQAGAAAAGMRGGGGEANSAGIGVTWAPISGVGAGGVKFLR